MTSPSCDRVFAIDELVIVILEQADTLALVNCQRVCRLWKTIIDRSPRLQEQLFMTAVPCGPAPRLNPVLEIYFKHVLGGTTVIHLDEGQNAYCTEKCSYQDLQKLPWARDGLDINAKARSAFARAEASWRRMLISQPPFEHLDWWQEWKSTDLNHLGYPVINGDCHEYVTTSRFTIGDLWDLLEARLLRGCSTQVTYFVSACSALNDPSSSDREKRGEQQDRRHADRNECVRIRVRSQQTWPGSGPEVHQTFDPASHTWTKREEDPARSAAQLHRYSFIDQRSMYLLGRDCANDAMTTKWRWSRSDAFRYNKLRTGGGNYTRRGPPATRAHSSV